MAADRRRDVTDSLTIPGFYSIANCIIKKGFAITQAETSKAPETVQNILLNVMDYDCEILQC